MKLYHQIKHEVNVTKKLASPEKWLWRKIEGVWWPMQQLKIDWDIDTSYLLTSDIEERFEAFLANGTDQEGRTWIGSANYYCGELDEIDDIELEHDIK